MESVSKIKPTVTLSAVITRADGTVEDLGIISQTKGTRKLHNFIKKIGGK